MIDSHTHIQFAGYSELESMALAGIEIAVSCTVGSPATIRGLYDEANNLLNIYRKNARNNGIELYIAVGIHPSSIPPDWKEGLDRIREFLTYPEVVAVGEVGINSARSIEVDVFREMVKIAKEHDISIIVHTPFTDRVEIVRKEMGVIESLGISPDLVVIDHVNTDIVDLLKKGGYRMGLTVREGRLKPEDVHQNLEIFRDGMLNSDLINMGPSDPLSVPKTVKYLRSKDVDKETIDKISRTNAIKFFRKIKK